MIFSQKKPEYYIIHETFLNPDEDIKHRKIIGENTVEVGGTKITTLKFSSVLQSFDVRNRNGRIYGKKIVMDALNNNPLIQGDLATGGLLSEWGHPIITKGMNEMSRQMTIFPPNTCARILKYHDEGNLLIGECETLPGQYGEAVRDRMFIGLPAQFSLRAIGGVNSNGEVMGSITICTFDIVYRPSHAEAVADISSMKVNSYGAPSGNTMTESVCKIDNQNESLKNFLLDESTSKEKIYTICDAFSIDADSMVISDKNITYNVVNENSIDKVIIPINKLINANYYELFL